MADTSAQPLGRVFDIQRWSLHDGPGVRTTVFLKGCSLECKWCANPESWSGDPEMAFFEDECIFAGACANACPYGAITMTSDGPVTDWSVCKGKCYRELEPPYPCTTVCHAQARRTLGRHMTVDQVLSTVERDRGIYRNSGGGLSVSGGEPFYQSVFLRALLREAKGRWLSTVVESCGFANWAAYEKTLEYVDFMYLDLKEMDTLKHREFTGQRNEVITNNARKIATFMDAKGSPLVIRTPVVPGLTATEKNIRDVAMFARSLPGVDTLELMPYHRLGRGKYGRIGREYELPDVEPPGKKEMEPLLAIVAEVGLNPKWGPTVDETGTGSLQKQVK